MASLTYNQDVGYWRRYLKFVPEEFRLRDEALPEEDYWDCNGWRVHLDRYVAPEAPAKLITVHGGGGYGRIFFLSGIAARDGCAEVVAPDLPGYGLSHAPRPYRYQDWVDVVAALIDSEIERDGRQVFLLGGSMGGLVAYSAAALRPQVSGVIATCLLDARRPNVRAAISRFRWLAPFSAVSLACMGTIAPGLRVPMKWVGNMSAMSKAPELNALVWVDPRGGGNSVPMSFLRSFLSYAIPAEPEAFDACPVLVVHPEQDSWTAPGLTREFYDRLSVPKTWVDLENAGHFPIEEPGIFQLRDAMEKFISQHTPYT